MVINTFLRSTVLKTYLKVQPKGKSYFYLSSDVCLYLLLFVNDNDYFEIKRGMELNEIGL